MFLVPWFGSDRTIAHLPCQTPPQVRHRLSLLVGLLLLTLLLLACGDGRDTGGAGTLTNTVNSTATPTATASPAATATRSPTPSVSVGGEVSGQTAFTHVQALADDIGPRVAGTDAERQAAEYIAEQFRSYGYNVDLPQFTFELFEDLGSELEVVAPRSQQLTPSALRLSRAGSAEASIVHVGLGRPEDYPPDGMRGRIALILRGEITFSEKVANAANAGASAAIVYNNSPQPFAGSLSSQSRIPAVAIPGAEGQALLELLDRGEQVTVRLDVQSGVNEGRSQNVVARPSSGVCRVLVGGHYDSVPFAPGASDNASGTATMIEVARAVAPRSAELGACFVAFGAEEVGLFGSVDFVRQMSEAERSALEVMINLDMVGVGSEWLLIGTPQLVERAIGEAAALGISARSGRQPPNSSSDHASFLNAGIPVVFIHRSDDPLFHTPQDVSSRVQPQSLEEAGRLTQRLLEVFGTS